MSMDENITIGIDLGTYNSVATVRLGEEPLILRSKEGTTDQGICFPSFVEFDDQGEFLRAGEFARRTLSVAPERVVWGVKRLIGKSYNEVKQSNDLDRFQYNIFAARDGSCRIKVGKREYSPTEISSLVLKKIKGDAEADFNPIGIHIAEATITVPAYFGPLQRAETEQAAIMAGFDKVRLIPEPTAAALAYKLHVEHKDQYIVVIDLGAGTLDVTVALLYLDSQDNLQTEEKGHGGDTALGGLDIDDAILQSVVASRRLQHIMRDSHGKAKLRAELERAKIQLSEKLEVPINFAVGNTRVEFSLRREEIEKAVMPVLQRCHGPIKIAMNEARMPVKDISHVLLVGGPSKMPIFRQMLIEKFAENPHVIEEIQEIEQNGFPVNPMEAIAKGAVLGAFGGITPHAYGILLEGAYFELIPRRTRYPCTNQTSHLVPGNRRSLVLQLIQKAVDPQSYKEVHILLGAFQFDFRPEPGQTHITIQAEYTQNGIFNLQIQQLSSMVTFTLNQVSKLEGRRINAPSSSLPIAPPIPMTQQQPSGFSGNPFGRPAAAPPPIEWTQEDLHKSIRQANRILDITRQRLSQAPAEEKLYVDSLMNSLRQSLNNTFEDVNTRTPQIRNYNRSLMVALHTSHLINVEEFRELQKGSD